MENCSLPQSHPMEHNKFLFKFPSGEWFWNGRRLSLEWWSPTTGTISDRSRSENFWVKVFGIPLHAWTLDSFKNIGDRCGGFIGIDEDTKNRTHLYWARICIRNSGKKPPATMVFEVGDWSYEITILHDTRSHPKPTSQKPVLGTVAFTKSRSLQSLVTSLPLVSQ